MQRLHWESAGLTILSWVLLLSTPVFGELKPGDVLGQANCREAKELLPERIYQGFCQGEFGPSEIIALPDEAFVYSRKFMAGSEANAGKYYITDEGYMYETATNTWPRYWYGFPFPELLTDPKHIDLRDHKNAYNYKMMYNHQVARFQIDDVYYFLALKWVTPTGFDRSVEMGIYATPFIGRHSGPTDNPDECYLKNLYFGIAPYDVVGVAQMEWWPTDPQQWQSIWSYVPAIRRVRRLSASNTSEGIFGSVLARDDPYVWLGKIQYMNWKLIGVQEMLVPVAPSGIEKIGVVTAPAPKKVPGNQRLLDLAAYGNQVPPGMAVLVNWQPEERITVGYENPGFQGKAWWPTNVKLAKRLCWVVEATPKDPYYAYGRRVAYIDQKTYWGYWATLYDRAGEYWKTILWMDKMVYTPGRYMSTRQAFWGLGQDDRQNRATLFDTISKGYFSEYVNGFPNSVFTNSVLSSLGK